MSNQIITLPATNGKHKHPIQTKPPYHCPHCGGPIARVLQYNTYRNPRAAHKPLDALGDHLQYLECPVCQIAHRAARLGDVILPFDWPPEIDAQGEARFLSALLREIVRLVGPQSNHDPGSAEGSTELCRSLAEVAASIVYRILAGTLAPQAAILEIRQLVEVAR